VTAQAKPGYMAAGQHSLMRTTIKQWHVTDRRMSHAAGAGLKFRKRSPTATEKDQALRPTHEKARAIRGPGASREFRFPNHAESRMAFNQILCGTLAQATIVQCKEPANSRIAFPPRAIMAAFRRARSALIQGE
jgi:hypothetical protein